MGFFDRFKKDEPPAPKRKAVRNESNRQDPLIDEKRRARRRLIGAVVLFLTAVIVLPMVLDKEPKPVSDDIVLQMPSKESPYTPKASSAPAARDVPKDVAEPVPDVPAQKAAPFNPDVIPPAARLVTPAEQKPVSPGDALKDVPVVPEASSKSTEQKASEPKPAQVAKPTDSKPTKPAEPKPVSDARAAPKVPEVAKPEPKQNDVLAAFSKDGAPTQKPAEPTKKYFVQVGAYGSEDKAREVAGKLKAKGIFASVEKVSTANGDRFRVRTGPFTDKGHAQEGKDKVGKAGFEGAMIQ